MDVLLELLLCTLKILCHLMQNKLSSIGGESNNKERRKKAQGCKIRELNDTKIYKFFAPNKVNDSCRSFYFYSCVF